MNFVKENSVIKFVLADYANTLPINKICWPPIMSNKSHTDSLGLYEQLEDETDGDWCLLTAYMWAEYFQHMFLWFIITEVYEVNIISIL